MNDSQSDNLPSLNLSKRKIDFLARAQGETVFSEKRNDFIVKISQRNTTKLNEEEIKNLSESSFYALGLAHQVSPSSDKLVHLIADDTFKGAYAQVSFTVGRKLIDDEPDSQKAGILHELIESLQEKEDIFLDDNSEVLPEIAEFLFTGGSRIGVFRYLNKHFFADDDSDTHVTAWGSVAKTVLEREISMDENPNDVFEEMLQKRNLPLEEKIGIIRKAIDQAREQNK